jgi:hypothetical protein
MSARVQYLSRRQGIESHYMATNFNVVDATTTGVSTAYRFPAWQRSVEDVKGWVTGGSQSCWLRG